MLDLVNRQRSIWHVALQSDRSRRSFRYEVEDAAIRTLHPLVAADGDHDIPQVRDRVLRVTRSGRLLLATVHAENPICTIAVADRSVGAIRLWQMLHENTQTRTDPAKPPAAPWSAQRLEVGFADHPEDARWLPDFERCLAWTWIESLASNSSGQTG